MIVASGVPFGALRRSRETPCWKFFSPQSFPDKQLNDASAASNSKPGFRDPNAAQISEPPDVVLRSIYPALYKRCCSVASPRPQLPDADVRSIALKLAVLMMPAMCSLPYAQNAKPHVVDVVGDNTQPNRCETT
jgi:hypothetical protein